MNTIKLSLLNHKCKIAVTALLLHLMALMLIAAYYSSSNLSYGHRMHIAELLKSIPLINMHGIVLAIQYQDIEHIIILCLTILILITVRSNNSSLLFPALFLVGPIILMQASISGIGYIVLFPIEALSLDGEWLGEHTPSSMSIGLWGVFSSWIAVKGFRLNRRVVAEVNSTRQP